MSSKNYYQILRVRRNCSRDELRRAYRALVRSHHPDTHPDELDATRRLQEINEAYETLSDPARQAEYDRQLELEESLERLAQARRSSPEPTRSSTSARPMPQERRAPVEPLDLDSDYDDYWPRRRRRSLLDDLIGDVDLDLDRQVYRTLRFVRRLLR
ncbi:MAG: DnaJ domain-containing protein [Chloroflexi bacterium]|nr:DnaJ domain-containing protein [Chloroflexota bacterium]MCL5110066.1 DnaJ domain-containing protein [Chloroflexota bacterium]